MRAIDWVVYLLQKLIRFASLIVAVSLLTFILVHLSPIDPVQAYIGADLMRVGPEQRQEIASYWGLDEPPAAQFMKWSSAMLRGDFGVSMIYREPVLEVIRERFLFSLALMSSSWLLSGVLGFIAGIVAAVYKDRWQDNLIRGISYILASTPTFWFGLLMLMLFAVWLGWFPIGLGVPAGVLKEEVTLGDQLSHMILPAMTLSVIGMAPIALHTRQKLIEVLSSDYVLFAKARGLKGYKLVYKHGLRNIALPALTLQFASFGELFGGAVLAEQVFSYPGLGQAMVESGLRGDVPLIMGLVLCSAVFVFAGNATADLLYRLLDPRIREGKGAVNQ